MRASAAILFITLAGFAPARADEPDPLLLVAEAKPARDLWQDCTAAAVKENLASKRSPEAIAALALEHCKAREKAVVGILKKRLGAAQAGRIVADLRAYDTLVLTRIIERLRGE
jgi:hypothetical protein